LAKAQEESLFLLGVVDRRPSGAILDPGQGDEFGNQRTAES
jgi:hypothetical protein